MQFGERIRELRESHGWTQKELSDRLGVSISYISKVENERLHFGDYPSEKFVHKLAGELDADENELLLLSDRVPDALRQRIRERPEVFNAVADLDNKSMDQLMQQIARKRSRVRTS